MAANMVNNRLVALRSRANDDFVPLTVNCQDLLYFGASRYQQDLLNLWWKLWKEQGFASLPPYSHLTEAKRLDSFEVGDVCLLNYDNKVCGTYRLCRVLSTKTTTGRLTRKIKVGYKERRAGRKYEHRPLTEVEIDMQRLALLVPTNKMEQLREPDELLKDNATGHNLKELFKEAGLELIEG